MPNRQTALIVRVIIALILLISVFVVMVVSRDNKKSNPSAQALNPTTNCTDNAGSGIQAGAIANFAALNVENLRSTSVRSSQTCEVYVTFGMSANSLDGLQDIAGNAFQEVNNITERAGFQNIPSSVDWGIRTDNPYLYSGLSSEPNRGQYIAIDTSNPEHYQVYVVYFTD